jgi:hypothetical protein
MNRFDTFNSREIHVLKKALKSLTTSKNASDSFVSANLLAEIEKPIDLIKYVQQDEKKPTPNE